jgi:hypothetical protein
LCFDQVANAVAVIGAVGGIDAARRKADQQVLGGPTIRGAFRFGLRYVNPANRA